MLLLGDRSNYGAPELRSLDDRPRKFDLTSELSEGDRYRLHSHFRKIMVRWEGQQWNAASAATRSIWGTRHRLPPHGFI